jgi:hypothetical protein
LPDADHDSPAFADRGAVIEHVGTWAGGRRYELSQDAGRNLVIRVPATPDRESAHTLFFGDQTLAAVPPATTTP